MLVDIEKLQAMGFNLMPLQKESKVPIGGADWTHLKTQKYKGSFPDSCNVAVICGEVSGGLFVVDLDHTSLYDDFKEFHDKTFIVKTGKGYHIYFLAESFLPNNKKFDDNRFRHVDVKSEGGYVLAPGSIHPDTKKPYEIVCDLPPMKINPQVIKEKLGLLGFNVNKKSIEEISKGTSEGGRNNETFLYTCVCIREKGLFGEALKKEVMELNSRHTPPMPESEVDMIIKSALGYEGHNIEKHVKKIESYKERVKIDNSDPIRIRMQDIDPKEHEGIPITFECMIIAVGERMTYTREMDFECEDCGSTKTVRCNVFHIVDRIPFCLKHKKPYVPIEDSRKTEYIQQLRIQEFLEISKNSSPIEFDAEILDENVGEAFISERKIITAKFRSIPQKNGYNQIVFEILKMDNMEQEEGCMPTEEEKQKWLANPKIFEIVRDSISSELFINPVIKESLMFASIGGIALNNKRSDVHVALLGDAQTAKSDLLEEFHKINVGSGYVVGGNVSAAGLTISMVKLYNGVSIPQAGVLCSHTGKPVIFDEIDKADTSIHNALLQSMEQGFSTMAKSGTGKPGMRLPSKCPMMIGGNPVNGGKFNPKHLNIMDNFNLSTPFISRLDIIWIMRDFNDPDIDDIIRDTIVNHQDNKENFMQLDELQRFFTLAKSLKPVMPKELFEKMNELHRKMRKLNSPNTIPIGVRQYHGLHRLLTACASAHLREVVTDEDFVIVENLILESYKTMGMNLTTGEVTENHRKSKDTKEDIWSETWEEVAGLEGYVDKDDFIKKLSTKKPYFDEVKARAEFRKKEFAGMIELDNDTEMYKRSG